MVRVNILVLVAAISVANGVWAKRDEAFVADGCDPSTPPPIMSFTNDTDSYTLTLSDYASNSECEWQFVADLPFRRFVVTAEIIDLDIESSKDCRLDYVQLLSFFDDAPDHDIGQFCGSWVPRNQPLSTDVYESLKVRFVSDQVLQGKGFSIVIRPQPKESVPDQVLGGTLYTRCGLEEDENPIIIEADVDSVTNRYRHNEDIEWTIKGFHGSSTITINNLDLESCTVGDDNCACDYLEIRGAKDNNDGKYCSSAPPPQIVANGEELHVRFKTDGSRNRPIGFKFTASQTCN